MAAIEVCDLTKDYGDVRANDGLSFSVEEGEIFGYLGPNGAGKTTTIRTLMGFQSPTDGTATVLGRDVRDEAALVEAKADVGYLPGDPGLDEGVTGREYLDYQASLKGDVRRDDLLELFDPPLDRKIREYSRGNKQMLGIVQAFMHDPALAIMDEPTSGLDPLKQELFNEFLREERERGKTVLFSSHVLGEVRRVCDRVGIIRSGRLVALEDVEILLRRGGKRVRVHTDGPFDPSAFEGEGIVDVDRFEEGAQFTFTGDYDALLGFLAEHRVVDLEIDEPPLEDVFMHYYGEESNGDPPAGGDARRDGPTDPDGDARRDGPTDPDAGAGGGSSDAAGSGSAGDSEDSGSPSPET